MRIVLRPITENDATLIVNWRNSLDVLSHCLTKSPITVESHNKFYREKVISGKYKQFIVERIDETIGVVSYPIATVYLKDVDQENKRCELCIFTSNDSEWIIESQSLAIKMLIEKAFNEYDMHKIYSYVFVKHLDEINLLKKSGFEVESILKEEAINENGQYEDIARMYIINNKYNEKTIL